MGKVGWYSLAVATLCTVVLVCVPWTVRVNVHTATALAEEDGLLSLLPEDAPVNLSKGSTATNDGPASDPLAGGATAATKHLPTTTTASTPPVTPAALLNARQQELSLRIAAGVADKPSPTASQTAPAPAKQTPKPTTAPSTTPKPKPAASPKTEIQRTEPSRIEPDTATTASQPETGFIKQIDLPEETQPAATEPEPAPSLRTLFTPDEIDDPLTDSALLASAGSPELTPGAPPVIATENSPRHVGVINTGHSNEAEETAEPTLGQILRGEAGENAVGSSLAGYNPLRSGAIVLLVLALMFTGAWLARKWRSPLVSLRQNTLAVIETISIGPGRQLIIVEMNNDALVLGVTPQSINMLDKVPLAELNGSYQHTVNTIVKREEHALPSDWQDRPAFTPSANMRPAPALASAATYGPSGRLTVSQLLQAGESGRASTNTGKPGIVSTQFLNEQNTKAELIDRIRQQLNNLGR